MGGRKGSREKRDPLYGRTEGAWGEVGEQEAGQMVGHLWESETDPAADSQKMKEPLSLSLSLALSRCGEATRARVLSLRRYQIEETSRLSSLVTRFDRSHGTKYCVVL